MINTVNSLGLIDDQTKGNWFTWTNGRHEDELVCERLDKSFANSEWIPKFPDFWVEVLPVISSYHSPLVIHNKKHNHMPNKKLFHYEAMWLQHPQVKEIVRGAWQKSVIGSTASQVRQKIHNACKDLAIWDKNNFGNLGYYIKMTQEQVEKMQTNLLDQNTRQQEFISRKKLDFHMKCEEIKWAQRAKKLWLVKGDINTKYFHSVVNHQRMKFRLKNIKLPNGPDGMTAMFYQHCWEIVQHKVMNMVGFFLSGGHLLRTMNHTHITLIPKVEDPQEFIDYRPISLYNPTYKIISKVLTNRLQGILPDLISPFQNAFVKCRLIQDNILIASEVLHYIWGCKKVKGDGQPLK
ncbi:reverse transcriptase [Senna tora]|uniref:Reverse transcriptase n=1 Tax=Senna tora TaxID=362788 RepID=A0A835CJZ8_9FABA|nr:reverse transcriptase [Senna tora]